MRQVAHLAKDIRSVSKHACGHQLLKANKKTGQSETLVMHYTSSSLLHVLMMFNILVYCDLMFEIISIIV